MNWKWMVGGIAMAVVFTGCGKKISEKLTEKMIEKGLSKGGVEAQVDLRGESMSFTTTDADGKQAKLQFADDTMTMESEEGTTIFQTGSAAQVPANFPSDVYVPAQAAVLSAITMPDGANVSLRSPDSFAMTITQYAEEMKSQGWATEATMETGESAMYSYAKGERRAHVVLLTDEGATTINISVSKE